MNRLRPRPIVIHKFTFAQGHPCGRPLTIFASEVWAAVNCKKCMKKSHKWFRWKKDEFQCCRLCGVVKRSDDRNGPCRGKVKITLRGKSGSRRSR
jgi:hypothetical protein